jgi:hypothetical protein
MRHLHKLFDTSIFGAVRYLLTCRLSPGEGSQPPATRSAAAGGPATGSSLRKI